VGFGTRGEIEDRKNKPTKKSAKIFVGRRGGVVNAKVCVQFITGIVTPKDLSLNRVGF